MAARNDDLELMWSSFCTEARQTLPPANGSEVLPVGFLPLEADDDLLTDDGDARRPPPALGWEQSSTEAQGTYISLLESFINDTPPPPQQQQQYPLVEQNINHAHQLAGLSGEAQRLRRENQMLKAKNTMLDRLLREANNRGRRAERALCQVVKHAPARPACRVSASNSAHNRALMHCLQRSMQDGACTLVRCVSENGARASSDKRLLKRLRAAMLSSRRMLAFAFSSRS